MVQFCEFDVFNGVRPPLHLMECQWFPVIQDMFIAQQDIAYSNQPDYGQRQGLGAEKELKTSEE